MAADPGEILPPRDLPVFDRETLREFAAASGDRNPIHLDPAVARGAGYPDVFAHGMLSAAHLAAFVTAWRPQARLRSLRIRFTAVTPLDAQPTCRGHVDAVEDGVATVSLSVTLADGTRSIDAVALVDVGDDHHRPSERHGLT